MTEEYNSKLESIANEMVTYRFVRTGGSIKRNLNGCNIPAGASTDLTVYGEFFKLCRYRPNISKKGKILWKLDKTIMENLKCELLSTGTYYSTTPRITCMMTIRDDYDSPDVVEMLHRQRARNSYPRPIFDVCFKLLDYFTRTDNNDVIDSGIDDEHAAFWIPTRKDAIAMLPPGTRIPGSTIGLHNKPLSDVETSQHENLRLMRTLKSQGWQTRRTRKK